MKNKKPLNNHDIDMIFKFLIQYVFKSDFSDLSFSDWQTLSFENTELTQQDLMNRIGDSSKFKHKWEKFINPQYYSKHQLCLNLYSIQKDNIESMFYDIYENLNERKLIVRMPEYLINTKFKNLNTEINFGSMPLDILKLINSVFGEFITHKNGVMSYIKVDDMCIYLHKYIQVNDSEITYVHKYILEPFQRFDANDMLIYERKENYNFIGDINNLITNKYTNEMFDKQFVNLTDDEAIILKMRLI